MNTGFFFSVVRGRPNQFVERNEITIIYLFIYLFSIFFCFALTKCWRTPSFVTRGLNLTYFFLYQS